MLSTGISNEPNVKLEFHMMRIYLQSAHGSKMTQELLNQLLRSYFGGESGSTICSVLQPAICERTFCK